MSGGGKTTITRELNNALPNSFGVFFDDFDDSTVHPDNLYQWALDGGDYNAWQTPELLAQLKTLEDEQKYDYVDRIWSRNRTIG